MKMKCFQSDFGLFQECLSGRGIPQNDPDCDDCHLDGDNDCDPDDLDVFQNCMTGSNAPADPECTG